jgi:hypothetical protein
MTTFRCFTALVTASLTTLLMAGGADAQTKATLTAKLIDPDRKAEQHAATVEVTTSGIELVDPALSNEKPVAGQGHLHYQLDKGPIIATPSAKLSFHELTPGAHTIAVVLASNDHRPLGPQQTLNVNIPKGATPASASAGTARETKPAASTPERKSGY